MSLDDGEADDPSAHVRRADGPSDESVEQADLGRGNVSPDQGWEQEDEEAEATKGERSTRHSGPNDEYTRRDRDERKCTVVGRRTQGFGCVRVRVRVRAESSLRASISRREREAASEQGDSARREASVVGQGADRHQLGAAGMPALTADTVHKAGGWGERDNCGDAEDDSDDADEGQTA